MNKIAILGIRITNCTTDELNEYICRVIEHQNKEAILNVNINCMNLAYEQSWLKAFLNATNVVFCDGEGVRLAARLLGLEIREKITYNRWIWELARVSQHNLYTWYMLGGKESVVRKAVTVLNTLFPRLTILGFHSGYFADCSEVDRIISDINSKRPAILLLGMGMPLQEKWLIDHLSSLEINIALTGGAVFDYISGNTKMTPQMFYTLKLEWFYRFLLEPKRLFKRYIIGNPLFFIRLLNYHLFRDKHAI